MLEQFQLFYRCVFGPTLYQTYPPVVLQLTLQKRQVARAV